MKDIKKLLVPTDFSPTAENAFRYALQLADTLDATIELVHAVFPEYEAMDLPVLSAHGTKLRMESAKTSMQAFIDRGIAQLQTASLVDKVPVVQSNVDIGSAVSVICKHAGEDDCNLVLMGTQGEHSSLEKFLGTVSTGVIKHSKVHVLLIPEDCDYKTIDTLAYATELESADPYHVWEAMQLLDLKDVGITLVHIEDPGAETTAVKIEEMQKFFENHQPGVKVGMHALSGKHFPELMTDFIESKKPDILVMHREKRNFFEGLIHHSHTREMALWTKSPLLVLKD